MTARAAELAVDLAGDLRCLAGGVVAVALGVFGFLVLAALSLMTSGVSATWLVLPCLVMLLGITAVTVWLVFRDGAQQDPSPGIDQSWW